MKKISFGAISLRGALIVSLFVPLGALASRSDDNDLCEEFHGLAKAVCMQSQRHEDDDDSSSESSVRSSKRGPVDVRKTCKELRKKAKKAANIAHKEWHRANTVGQGNEVLHKQWHTDARAAEKELKLRVRGGQCGASSTSSSSSVSSVSSSVSSADATSSLASSSVSSSSTVSPSSSESSASSN